MSNRLIAGGTSAVDAVGGLGLRTMLRTASCAQLFFRFYGQLPKRLQAYLYWYFATTYRDRRAPHYATWVTVDHAGAAFELPLRAASFAIDFNVALSLPIHDRAVKETYARLAAEQRPTVFIDIGANFGTHSFIWAAAGARVYSIEPNPHCHGYLRSVAERNGLSIELLPVAVADRPATLSLFFPRDETWLGAVAAAGSGAADPTLERVDGIAAVPLDELDIEVADGTRVVIKIDVEGHEAAVLRGARHFIATHRPVIVFEARPQDDRRKLADQLEALGYRLMTIGDHLGRTLAPLTIEHFVRSSEEIFLATPEPS